MEKNTKYDERHGGPYDRGTADKWYGRKPRPHYFTAGTYSSPEVVESEMNTFEILAYWAGYDDQDETKY